MIIRLRNKELEFSRDSNSWAVMLVSDELDDKDEPQVISVEFVNYFYQLPIALWEVFDDYHGGDWRVLPFFLMR